MKVDIQEVLSVDHLVDHIRHRVQLDPRAVIKVKALIELALFDFLDFSDQYLENESGRLRRAIEGVDNALANTSNDWQRDKLYSVRRALACESEQLFRRFAWAVAELPQHAETRSVLPAREKRLIERLCRVWHYRVGKLGLGKKVEDPESHLLRFLDAALAQVLGNDRPSMKKVNNFLHGELRQIIYATSEKDDRN